jgi:hypothetical protein
VFPSIVSPTAAMVTEAVAVEEFGSAALVEMARALATSAADAVADVFVGSAGRLGDEQADRTSNAAEPMIAQDPFTNAARFRCRRPGNAVCRECGSRQYKTALYRMQVNLAWALIRLQDSAERHAAHSSQFPVPRPELPCWSLIARIGNGQPVDRHCVETGAKPPPEGFRRGRMSRQAGRFNDCDPGTEERMP